MTQSEVIKFSASGFRDFTRIAASDPTMWRDIFLNNRDAVLEMLGRFNEDLAALAKGCAGATATPCTRCSPAPAPSAAASSRWARIRPARISDGAARRRVGPETSPLPTT